MGIAERRLAMFDALLSGRGLQGLVDAAAEVFGNPVAVADMGLAMVAVSSELADDPEWTANAREIETNDMRQAALAGDFRRVYSGDKTVVGEYPGADQRYLAARVRRKDALLGHALVLERNRPFTDDDIALLPDVCRTFGYELAGAADADQLAERHGKLFEDLLSGSLADADEVEARAQRAHLRVPRRMCALIAHSVSDKGQISPRYLRTQLVRAFPGSLGMVRGDDVLVVVNADDAGDTLDALFAKSVYSEGLCVGMSFPFHGLHLLLRAYEQAQAAIRLSAGAPGIVRYQQVVARHMMERASLTIDGSTFIHPALDLLEEADEREHSNHLADLEAYLSSGRNATATARALHVHKNTMYYRLQRIEQITGIDLSNEETCFALQLALLARG